MKYKKIFFAAISLFMVVGACKTEKEILVEPQKDLTGVWHITQVIRDANDITEWVDSTGFRLILNNDNSYTLGDNNLPFLVSTAGTWKADDPQYPYNLIFTPSGSDSAVTGRLGTPVIKGNRSMNITFSPGCYKNTYIYTLEKNQ